MHSTALLALAAQKRSAVTRKPASSKQTHVIRRKPSGTLRPLRMVTALAASLVLVVSLVDPLLGQQAAAHDAIQEQGSRHE